MKGLTGKYGHSARVRKSSFSTIHYIQPLYWLAEAKIINRY